MEAMFSIEEAMQKLLIGLSETTGWKYLKSQRCLKKVVKDLVFEINIFASKWNLSHRRVEVNAEFRLWCKNYGNLPVNNVIATISYHPDDGSWYDISSDEKFRSAFEDLNNQIQKTAVNLCTQFEQDYLVAVESLLNDYFDEYNVYLDFITDKLGISVIQNKVREIYNGISDEMRRQALAYQNGARDKAWMINRSNLKYIMDNDLLPDANESFPFI